MDLLRVFWTQVEGGVGVLKITIIEWQTRKACLLFSFIKLRVGLHKDKSRDQDKFYMPIWLWTWSHHR